MIHFCARYGEEYSTRLGEATAFTYKSSRDNHILTVSFVGWIGWSMSIGSGERRIWTLWFVAFLNYDLNWLGR